MQRAVAASGVDFRPAMLEWSLVHGSLIAFFILANSFFVAAEFALVNVRETRLEQLAAQNRPGARTALELKHNLNEFLPAVQFGVTLASLALGGLGEPALADAVLHELTHVGFLSRLPMVQAHALLYAHSAAVVLALQRSERIVLAIAGPMDVFIQMTGPAVRLMNVSATLVLRLFHAPLSAESSVHSPEELKMLATATRRMGMLPPFQEQMIQ